jgi:branched-subunit amino acid aminotransferase/4-amino-4-deoxychorismate lyase
VVESDLFYAALANYDELFITSSTKEILPVVQVDDQVIGDGKPGPKTQKLLDLFHTYIENY